MKAQVETTGAMTVRTTAESKHGTQLRALSSALRDVHRGLLEVSRERYELANPPVRTRGELLQLLLHDETFAWLRQLSELIVEIDELAARDPAPTEAETVTMGALIRAFTSSADDPDAFGTRYVALLSSEPRVAMSHIGLRDALGALPEPRVEARKEKEA
jgi:hypothetical protein